MHQPVNLNRTHVLRGKQIRSASSNVEQPSRNNQNISSQLFAIGVGAPIQLRPKCASKGNGGLVHKAEGRQLLLGRLSSYSSMLNERRRTKSIPRKNSATCEKRPAKKFPTIWHSSEFGNHAASR